MKVWNVTNKETPELIRLGLLNVQCQVGEVTLKPGESTDVPEHVRAEIAPLLRQKILSDQDPDPPKVEEKKAEPTPPTAEASKDQPAPPPAEPPAEKPQGRRPRGE